jgi:hypothetical protein
MPATVEMMQTPAGPFIAKNKPPSVRTARLVFRLMITSPTERRSLALRVANLRYKLFLRSLV